MENKVYLCIDLKSFYASVECVSRNLDPLTTNLVVADISRTEKTICLAITPALKSLNIRGRPRLFEVIQDIEKLNKERKIKSQNHKFKDKSYNINIINSNNDIAIDFIIAPPRMKKYMEVSSYIYSIYLNYVSKDDIHVYSIDEVFIDVTKYLKLYKMTSNELAKKIISDVYNKTGITATAGIGTNLYLAKVAMDILAKKANPDENGVRMAYLNEQLYRELLWDHVPLTDFWRVGRGYNKTLNEHGIFTMGDIALCSIGKTLDYHNEDLLYSLFGINAELLIDHAWGKESCTMEDIKKYKPLSNSLGSGQVLHCAYDYNGTKTVVKEMIDQLVLDLIEKNLLTDHVSLYIGYDIDNLKDPKIKKIYKGKIVKDYLNRDIPKPSSGRVNLHDYTSSRNIIMENVMSLFEQLINKNLLVRRLNISCHVINKTDYKKQDFEQLNLFETPKNVNKDDKLNLEKEQNILKTILKIKKKYGKNSLIRGIDLTKDATQIERNKQIGGHKE